MFKRFISYYKPHKFMLFLDMLASFMISIIGLFYPIITRQMMNDWIPNAAEKLNYVIIFGCVLIGIYFVRAWLRFFVQYYGHIIGVKMQAAMRTDLFNKLQKLPYTYYDNHETGNADKFKEVTAAYELLSDPAKRIRFDRGEIDANGNERAGFGFNPNAGGGARWQSTGGFGGAGRLPGQERAV